jgi:hypothetical protein
MPAPTDFNLDTLRGRVFLGFLQFKSPTATEYYRLKERQAASITYRYNLDTHYTDAGKKGLDPAGQSHTVVFTIKVTSDMFDNTATPSNGKTISYWIYKHEQFAPVEIYFTGTMETLSGPAGSTSEKFLHFTIKSIPHTFGPITWNPSGGSHEMQIVADVVEVTVPQRSSTGFANP